MKTDPKQANKGMYISSIPEEQPQGTYPFMLNAVRSKRGNTHREREKSSELRCPLSPGQLVVGESRLREELTVFLIHDSSGLHKIIDQNCNVLYESECLGFSNAHYLDVQHRTVRGCNDVLYITGLDYEPRRVDLSNTDQINSCSDIKLIPDYDIPCIRARAVDGGGIFNPGSYNVAIQYLTDDLAETPWIIDTHTVYIGTGFSQEVDPEEGVSAVASSIEVNIQGTDSDFAYYRLALIEANAGTGVVSDVVTTHPIPINQTQYVLTGQPTGGERISIEQIIQDKIEFRGAEHAVQLEGRLVLSNIQLADYDQCNWQKYVSPIKTKVNVVKTPKSSIKDRTFFMGDEVYAFFIQFKTDTGWTSNMFHIPGPTPGKYDCKKLIGGGSGPEVKTKYCIKATVIPAQACTGVFGDITVRFRIRKPDGTYQLNPDGDRTWEVTRPIGVATGRSFTVDLFCTTDFEVAGFEYDPSNGWDTNIDRFDCPIAAVFLSKSEHEVIVNHGGGTTFSFIDNVDLEVPLAWSTEFQHLVADEEAFEAIISQCPECINGTLSQECRNALYEKADMIGLPRRWQIENTATPITDTIYRPGYYACKSATYEAKACVDDYWGVDECGEELAGTPLRFTRMPSRRQVPMEDGEYINTFEVEFTGIDYPHPSITGHRILYAKRTPENKTIFDKGMLTTLWVKELVGGDHLVGNQGLAPYVKDEGDGHEWAQFVSPKTQFYKQQPTGDHYRLEELRGQDLPEKRARWEADDWSLVESSFLREANAYIFAGTVRLSGSEVPEHQNVAVERSWLLDPTSFTDHEGHTIVNYSLTTHHAMSMLRSRFMLHDQYLFKVNYASTRSQRDVYCQLNALVGIPAHDCWLTLNEPTIVSDGDTFISEFVMASLFACVGADVISQHEDTYAYGLRIPELASDIFARTGQTPVEFSNNYGAHVINSIDAISQPNTRIGAFFNNREPVASGEAILNFWVESDINVARRHSNTNKPYYGKTRLLPHFRNQILVNEDGPLGSGKDWIVLDNPYKEAYLYNKDFSRIRQEKIGLPLPFTYDCCSNCPEYFPTRRWWSDKGNQEQLTDRYRYFRANNYNDIEAEFGAITASWKVRNNLIFQTQERLYIQPLNMQQRVSDLTLTIGTGEFMSLDAQPALTKGGGTIDKRSVVVTPVGVFFADRVTRTFWVYTDRLTPLPGMEPFFEEEMDTKRTSDYVDTIIGGYDPHNERVIWTKIDIDGDADLSWTISFDIQEMMWVSFHSYKPKAYSYGENTLFMSDSQGIHALKTTEGDYNNYFGVQSPFVVDMVLTSPLNAVVWNDIEFYAYSLVFDAHDNPIDSDETFSHMIAWTSYQITGELELINSLTTKQEQDWMIQSITENNRTADISRVARGWNINALRNILTSTSIPMFFTSRRHPLVQNAYYVDRVLNEAAIDYDKSWLNRDYLHDTFLRLRLIQKSKRAVQLIVNYLIGDASDQNL